MRIRLALFALLLLALPLPAQELRLLVGTYTEGTPAEGVYLYAFDLATADARLLGVAPCGNPSFVIPSPDGSRAYAVNEYNDGRQGVSAFSLEDGGIRLLGTVPIPEDQVDGGDPCNLLYTGGTVVSSNYSGGSVTAFAIGDGGVLEGLSQYYFASKQYRHALVGTPLGSEKAHMHCAVLSPDGKYIFVTDLGMDCIHRLTRCEGIHPLGAETIAWENVPLKKYGPRHLIFSADGRFAYLLCELSDTLVVFSYSDGTLTPIQSLTAYKGRGHGSADLHLSPDGRFLYTSHRLKEDGISVFAVDRATGKVKKAGWQPTGTHPRNFALSPDGNWLLCACRDDNRIEIYRIDKTTGALSPAGRGIELGAPVCVQFVSAP